MGRVAGRASEETRRLILDAAARLIGQRGVGVALGEIAATAGVSKGGLLYHFPSKTQLVKELAVDLMEQFRVDVEQRASMEPPGAGRLTRAYIRASFTLAADEEGLRDYAALAVHLMYEPGIAELAQADARAWRTALMADGLDPAVVRMIIIAVDGSNSTPLWGSVLTADDRDAVENELIGMTLRGNARGNVNS